VPDIWVSVSVTTRAPRPGEVEGSRTSSSPTRSSRVSPRRAACSSGPRSTATATARLAPPWSGRSPRDARSFSRSTRRAPSRSSRLFPSRCSSLSCRPRGRAGATAYQPRKRDGVAGRDAYGDLQTRVGPCRRVRSCGIKRRCARSKCYAYWPYRLPRQPRGCVEPYVRHQA